MLLNISWPFTLLSLFLDMSNSVVWRIHQRPSPSCTSIPLPCLTSVYIETNYSQLFSLYECFFVTFWVDFFFFYVTQYMDFHSFYEAIFPLSLLEWILFALRSIWIYIVFTMQYSVFNKICSRTFFFLFNYEGVHCHVGKITFRRIL